MIFPWARENKTKIGAWVSDQSEPIASRDEMTTKAKEIEVSHAYVAPLEAWVSQAPVEGAWLFVLNVTSRFWPCGDILSPSREKTPCRVSRLPALLLI